MDEKVLITKSSMEAIGDAIRYKRDEETEYLPSEMPTAIESIPNKYTLADEGKVVSNGQLVAQTARATEITTNGTYDTTENNEVTVNVSGSSPVVQPLSVTQNGTYNLPSGVDGFAPVTVNVSGGGGGLDGVYLPEINSSYATLRSGSNIVVQGHHAEMVLGLSFTNKRTGVIGSIPSSIKPAGVAYFRLGNGGNTSVGYGIVTPDGEIQIINSGFGGNYAYLFAEWDIPEQSYELLISDQSIVRSVLGKIAKIGNICTLCCKMTIQASNDGWKNNIITIPEAIRPDEAILGTFYDDPYDIDNMSPPVKDVTYSTETGSFSIWLPNGSNFGTFRAVWGT